MRHKRLQPALLWHSWLFFAILGIFASQWALPAAASGCILFFLDRRLHTLPRFLCASLFFALPCLWAHWQFNAAEQIISAPPAWLAKKDQRFCGQIQYAQGLPDYRLRFILQNVHLEDSRETLPGLCQLTWDNPASFPLPGQNLCITRAIRAVGGFDNAEANSFAASLLGQQIYWRIWTNEDAGNPQIAGHPHALAQLRQNLQHKFQSALGVANFHRPPQDKAILLALLFGDRFYLQQATVDAFAAATLAHSLALSGQHLGVAGLIGYAIILVFVLVSPNLYLQAPRALLILLASLPFALLYLWLGNAPPSLQRAAAMLFLATLWLWRRRTFTGLDILCAALFLLILLSPLSLFSPGLQLSALCVAIILLSWPALSRLLPTPSNNSPTLAKRLIIFAAPALLISLTIQLALLPLTLLRFQQAGFLFPLNLLWLPVLALIVLPISFISLGFAALPFHICQIASAWLLDVAALPCHLLLQLLQFLNNHHVLREPAFLLPHWTALLAFCLLTCGVAWIFTASQNQRSGRLLCALCLLLLAVGPCLRLVNSTQTSIHISALDVGQGESILVQLPDSQRLLMDGGGSYSARFDPGKAIIAPIITDNAPPALSAVFNSHPDQDHAGGLLHILENMNADSIFHNGQPARKASEKHWRNLQSQSNAHVLVKYDELILGNPANGLRLEVLHPPANDPQWEGNGASLVLRLTRNGYGLALFPGDADKKALKYILEHNANLQADVVIAPHHGSDKELLAGFYKACQPKLVLACCGFGNHRGFPGAKTRNWLQKQQIPLLDTGRNGRITVEFDKDNTMIVEKMK